MSDRHIRTFRLYFVVGLVISFISLFLDWYLLQGVDSSGAVLIDWSYNLVINWYSPSQLNTELNNWYRPVNASVPLPLVLFFIGLLVVAAFGALAFPPEKLVKGTSSKSFEIVNVAVMMLISYFIVIFPIVYLFPNQLLFPALILYDYEAEISYSFLIGYGYWMQLVAFAFCFPYTCLYYSFANDVEVEREANLSIAPNNAINLDKLIAEMELIVSQQFIPSKKSNNLGSKKTPELIQTEAIIQQYVKKYGKEEP